MHDITKGVGEQASTIERILVLAGDIEEALNGACSSLVPPEPIEEKGEEPPADPCKTALLARAERVLSRCREKSNEINKIVKSL